MRSKLWVLAVVIAGCAGLALVLTVGWTSPEPIASAALGPDWQCSRVALVMTTCHPVGKPGAATTPLPEKPATSWRRAA